jgi:hypothetical protein
MVSENLPAFLIGSLGICCLAVSLNADEVTTCKSPDGKFALRCIYGDKQPFNGDAAIVDMPAHKTVLVLDPNWTLGFVKLVWSSDSQRVAYFSEKGRGNDYATRVFFRHDASFSEIALPDLPLPKLPAAATTGSDAKTSTRIEPMSWSGPGDLLVEKELLNRAWGRAALRITLGFDQENRPFVRSAEQEKVSIVDYFLLLPAEEFEARPDDLLRVMRMGGFFQLCDAKPREKDVDEKNGYMSGGGDGAQASFDVALFRHRDGRPLLAFSQGEEPELGTAGMVYLKFFELGGDGKMHETNRSIFPIADSEDYSWQFELPREGRTVVVRARKSRKILHKIAWTGEKFEERK